MIITDSEKQAIIKVVMKNGKGFRASKPKVDKNDPITGRTAYVCRMVGFQISRKNSLLCMPVTAVFDYAEEDWKNRKEVTKALDEVVAEIVDAVPPAERYGVNRWARALGY